VKVLQLIHNQHRTGPYPKILEQAEALQELGARVTLLCTSRTHRFHLTQTEERGVRVVIAPDLLWGRLRQGADLWNTLRRLRFAMREPFDLVHAIDARPTVILPALWRKWRLGTPLVLSWWDLAGDGATASRSGLLYARTVGRLEGRWESMFRLSADRATVISNDLRGRLEALGYPRDHILVQRVGCDTRAYGPADKTSARARLTLPPDATILCYVGALLPPDQRLLKQALCLVGARYRDELLIVMIGTPVFPDDGGSQPRLLRVGPQPLEVVYRYLAAADLCLLPMTASVANRARWPSKVADYFNAGRPVVATKVSDLDELYAQHSLGYVAEHASPEGYAEALLRALDARAECEAVGGACRRFAQEHLDTRVLARDLMALYEGAAREGMRTLN